MIVSDEITREERSHTYWRKDGYRVVGITELLAAMGYLGKGYFNDEALRRGKNVHLALHYFAKGTLDPKSLSPRIRPYFDSAVELLTQKGAKIVLSEAYVFDPLSAVACQLDAIWQVGEEQIVVDYKSTALASNAIAEWVKYQTGAAVNGLTSGGPTPPKPYRRWGLKLRGDGKPAAIREFLDPKDMAMVRVFASTFYTKVNDKVIKWPQTQTDLEKQRSEENGIDLFGGLGTQAFRDGEGTAGELSIANGTNGAS